jgi:signal transduction histidine kinase
MLCLLVVASLVPFCLAGCGGHGEGGWSPAAAPVDAEHQVLKAAVRVGSAGLGAIAVNPDGSYNTAMIRQFVHAIRFLDDDSGYFFVYDYTSNFNIAHAVLLNFEGQDKTSYQNSRGLFVIQELSKIAASPAHAGFLTYHWNNPTTGREEEKLGYVEVIPGTTLYIGSGIYHGQR